MIRVAGGGACVRGKVVSHSDVAGFGPGFAGGTGGGVARAGEGGMGAGLCDGGDCGSATGNVMGMVGSGSVDGGVNTAL